MSCYMRRQMFIYPGKHGDLGKIGVHPLVGYYGQNQIFGDSLRMAPVFLGNPSWDFKQRYCADLAGLLTRLAYPFLSVLIFYYVVACKCGYVDERKTAEAAEYESIAHEVKARQFRQVEFHYGFQLILGQKFAVGLCAGVTLADERVVINPFVAMPTRTTFLR